MLETLEDQHPHLFEVPPHGLDKWWPATLYTAWALLQSGDAQHGAPMMREVLDSLTEMKSCDGENMNQACIVGALALGYTGIALAKLKEFSRSNSKWTFPDICIWLSDFSFFAPIRNEPEVIEFLEMSEDQIAE